jgi:serine acetyltransferase
MGEGTIVTAGNHMTTGISLGRFVIVNLACTLGHDVTIRDFSTIMPGSNISGYVSIGEGTLIGTGAKVLQHLVIGNNSKIGAGAVVTRNVGDNIVAVGVPARERKGV